MESDPTRLNKEEMAKDMMASLRHNGVDVDYGTDGWQTLLEAISEGVIVHLEKHSQAFVTSPGGAGEHRHDHGPLTISVADNTKRHRA